MLIRPAIGDTDPIRYRRPNPDGQFSGNILDEAMRPSSASNFDLRRGLLVALGSSEPAGVAETRQARVACSSSRLLNRQLSFVEPADEM
jgi:hypothetical protein